MPPPASAPATDWPLAGAQLPLVESQYRNVTPPTPTLSPTPEAERTAATVSLAPSAGPARAMVGGVVSETVTVKLPLAEVLPEASLAVQLTVVVPSGKVEPETGEHVTVGERVDGIGRGGG